MQRFDDFDNQDEPGIFSRVADILDPEGRLRARSPIFALVTVGVLALLLITVVWVSYPRSNAPEGGPVPLIRADAGPVKVAPDSEGGMDIPYRESTVFSSMRGEDGGKVENLLPAAEQPVDRNQVFAGLKDDAKNQQARQPVQESTDLSEPAPVQKTESSGIGVIDQIRKEAAATPVKPQSVETKPEISAPKEIAKTDDAKVSAVEPASGEQPKTANGDQRFIQLAAIKEQSAAASAWKKLQKDFPEQLKTQNDYRVKSASVNGKTLYRLQAGPFSEGKAKSLCKAIAAKKPGSCLVVPD